MAQRLAAVDIMQIVRYYSVGALVNTGGYAAFLLLLRLEVGAKLAASALYLIGALISFWLNRRLVFDSSVDVRSALLRLVVMLLAGYALNMVILYVLVDKLALAPWLVQAFSVVVVSVFFYAVNKFYVHKSARQ